VIDAPKELNTGFIIGLDSENKVNNVLEISAPFHEKGPTCNARLLPVGIGVHALLLDCQMEFSENVLWKKEYNFLRCD
jgi:hypothetical protein